jgi:hypothetical protein
MQAIKIRSFLLTILKWSVLLYFIASKSHQLTEVINDDDDDHHHHHHVLQINHFTHWTDICMGLDIEDK